MRVAHEELAPSDAKALRVGESVLVSNAIRGDAAESLAVCEAKLNHAIVAK